MPRLKMRKSEEREMNADVGMRRAENQRKGFGFLEHEDGPDVFVHHSGINASGFKSQQEGDRVTFGIEEGPKA